MADSLKAKQKFSSPNTEQITDPEVKLFSEDLAKGLLNAFRDVYDDLKLLLIRLTRHQTLAFSPAQITAAKNNYDPGEGALLRLSTDAPRNITGFSGGTDGRRLMIINVGAQNIVLTHQDAASLAANRILSQTGANVTMAGDAIQEIIYDAVTLRWRI